MSGTSPEHGIIYRWEPPDTSFLTYIGDITGDDVRNLNAEAQRYVTGIPYVVMLADISRLGKVSAEAREATHSHSRWGQEGSAPLRGVAIFGASLPMRVIFGFAVRAYNLITRQKDNPTRFFDSEAAARAWLAKRREALCAGIVPAK